MRMYLFLRVDLCGCISVGFLSCFWFDVPNRIGFLGLRLQTFILPVCQGGPPVQPQPGASTHCGLARLRQLAKSNPVDIQGCIEITRDDLCHPTNVEKHMIKELQQFQQLDKHKRVFAWKIGHGCRFKEPIPYKHNKGAVSWVRLKEVKKTRINTRWQLHHDFRHQMSK